MTGPLSDEPGRNTPQPAWDEKVIRLNDVLGRERLPYAFGGAIALNYHREPRSTLDIDVNVFVRPEDERGVIHGLTALYEVADAERLARELREQGQTRALWGITYIDVFLSTTDFHDSMAARVGREPFGDVEIPVLSIEDLIVCKVLFDRPKDWLDVDAVTTTRRGELDGEYVLYWLREFLEPADARLDRARAALTHRT
jgi:hypothetical protein